MRMADGENGEMKRKLKTKLEKKIALILAFVGLGAWLVQSDGGAAERAIARP